MTASDREHCHNHMTDKKMITVRWKCACMAQEGSLQIEARRFSEPIEVFMITLTTVISDTHRRRNALCRNRTMEYIKIPANHNGVGVV